MACNICHGETTFFASATVRHQYDAVFVLCSACNFLQIENPYWLEEAYGSAITSTDMGLVSRNISFSKTAKTVIETLFDHDGKFIDFGGGTGLFTRLMRDSGYDFYCFDSHCPNHFAEHFIVELTDSTVYDLLTSVEVFEHLTDPLSTVQEMAKFSPNILFTTQVLPTPIPKIEDWWYYGLEHGQHVSFYGITALEALSRTLGLHFTSNGSNLHLFSERLVSPLLFKALTNRISVLTISSLLRRPSLLNSDFLKIHNQERDTDADCP